MLLLLVCVQINRKANTYDELDTGGNQMKLAALQESWMSCSAILCDEISMCVIVNLVLFVVFVNIKLTATSLFCAGGVKGCLGNLLDV